MKLTKDQFLGLDVALNGARLLGLTVDPVRRVATATLQVCTLPLSGPPPADARVQFQFYPVGEVAAALKHGRWNDSRAPVECFTIDQLDAVVRSFEGRPISGWQFFDVPAKRFARWCPRLSLCLDLGTSGLSHMLTLFQEDGDRRALDICLWFDEVAVHDLAGAAIPLDDFIDGGLRWWDAFYRRDSRIRPADPADTQAA